MQGAFGRAVAGDTAGKAMEAGAAFLAGGACVAGAAAAQASCPAELVQGSPGIAGARLAVGETVVARVALVTMRSSKPRMAWAAAGLVAALGQGSCRAAAAQLAEREAEVARGTAITCGPLEALSAPAPACVRVTAVIGHSRAGTLAGLAAGAIEPWHAELTMGALEVGFAHTASHSWVLPAGVALGPCRTAVTIHNLAGWQHLLPGVIGG